MSSSFDVFQKAINKQWAKMVNSGALFETECPDIWEKYLDSFPPGTNPIFRERTEHDCSCCKNFVRNIGSVVAIINDKKVSVWDCVVDDSTYSIVADAMAKKVKKAPIIDQYFTKMKSYGSGVTPDNLSDIQWSHFYAKLPSYAVSGDAATFRGNVKTNYKLLSRSIKEISDQAIEDVLDLIQSDSIYRGAEHKNTVEYLQQLKEEYAKSKNKGLWLWQKAAFDKQKVRVKNTVIGTLLVDISNGVNLEEAVRSFESKVAPQNYKRSNSLVTKAMVEKAQAKVKELGIEASLPRRYAVAEDVNVNDVLFVDRSVRSKMKGGDDVFDDLKEQIPSKKPNIKNTQEISVNDFIENVMPRVTSIELLLENRHEPNMMSLIAPQNEDAPGVLKWDNNFSWSYKGDVTDSIKERVKKAGGNVTGDVRASLSWYNYDDLDLHCNSNCGSRIYYSKKYDSVTKGKLDVDMNIDANTRKAVENIFWPSIDRMKGCEFSVVVQNFNKRENIDVGFDVELEIKGDFYSFSYKKPVKHKEFVDVATFSVGHDGSFVVTPSENVKASSRSKAVWGVNTGEFVPVKMITKSPNHWGDQEIGNKHWFFILKDCINPEEGRGLYNEFISGKLNEHRKVFEMLGGTLKAPKSDNQLSGLGFSSTQRNDVVCRVSGEINRVYKIKF